MYHVYILRCSDGSPYVGYTTNLDARLKAHNSGLGAKYTFKRRPVVLVYSESQESEIAAIRRERQRKGWSRGADPWRHRSAESPEQEAQLIRSFERHLKSGVGPLVCLWQRERFWEKP